MVKLLILLFSFSGGQPGVFLNYGGTPRSLALGKTFCGLADDQEACYFNPGGLSQILSQEVRLSHFTLYGARMEYIGYSLPTRLFGSFGISFINFGSDKIESRTERNESYEPAFFYENAYIFSYSYSPVSLISFGTNLKIVTKNYYLYSGVGVGFDLGIFSRPTPALSFGLFLQNILEPTIKLLDEGDVEVYPRSFRFGLCWRTYQDRVKVLTDFLFSSSVFEEGEIDPHLGVEFELVKNSLIQRVGVDKRELAFGFGFGKVWNKSSLFIDYALLLHYQSSFLLTPTHKLGLAINFGGFRVWVEGSPKVFSPQPGVAENLLGIALKYSSKRPIKRWQLLIKNDLGEVVRSYSGWEEAPTRLTWDGLDEATRLVADGKYFYEVTLVDIRNESFQNSGFLCIVKTLGPKGQIRRKE